MKLRKLMFFSLLIMSLFVVLPNVDAANYTSLRDAIIGKVNGSSHTSLYDASKSSNSIHVNTKLPTAYTSFGFGTSKSKKAMTIGYEGSGNFKTLKTNAKTYLKPWKKIDNNGLTYQAMVESASVPVAAHKNGNAVGYYACYPEFGTYNGQKIDVKAKLTSYVVSENTVKGKKSQPKDGAVVSFNDGVGVNVFGLDYVVVNWSFHKSNGKCTGSAFTVSGNTTYWDVDNQQGIAIPFDATNDGKYVRDTSRKGLYISSSSNKLKIGNVNWYQEKNKINRTYRIVYYDKKDNVAADNKNYAFTEVFKASSMNRTYSFWEKDGTSMGGIGHSNKAVVPASFEGSKDYADGSAVTKQHVSVRKNDVIKYKLSWKNGTGTMAIEDTISAGLEYVPGSSTGGEPTQTAGENGKTVLRWSTTTATGSLTYSVKVAKDPCVDDSFTNVLNTAYMTVDGTKYSLGTLKNPVPSKCYNPVTNSGKDNASVKVGDVIKYKVKVPNTTDSVVNAEVRDTLSTGLVYNKDAAVSNGTLSGVDGTKFTISNIPVGQTAILTYSAKVTEAAGYYVNNSAFVKIGNNDPGISLAELKNPVPKKEYGGTVTDNPGWDHKEVKKDQDVKYKVVIPTVKATTVTVTDVLSEGLDYNKDAAISGTNCTLKEAAEPVVNSDTGKTTLVWTVTAGANTTCTLNYSGKVNKDAVNLVNNSAHAFYIGESNIPLDDLYNPVPRKEYDVETPNGMNGKIVQKNDVIRYNIGYANGYKEKADITLRDTLSKGLKYKEKSAKVCDIKKENCKSLDELGITETVTPKEDGTTEILWVHKNVEPLDIRIIVYDIDVTGETIRVDNHFEIKMCRAGVACNNEYTDITRLKNPVPVKEYGGTSVLDNPGWGNASVKKGSKIKYKIRYANVADEDVNVTVTDTLSKGLTYLNGTSKIDGKKIDDPSLSDNKQTLTWKRSLKKDQEEELTYTALVTGETSLVNNKAVMEYSNNPGYKRELNKLYNPVPKKTYAKDTKAGKNGAYVKKKDIITYSIAYSNYKEEDSTVVITDNLSKGLKYVKGSATINGQKVDPDSIVKGENGTLLVWTRIVKSKTKEVLNYSVKVTGESKIVQNNANIQFDDDSAIHLDELKNPLLLESTVVKAPNTASSVEVASLVLGVILVCGGGYIIYRKYKLN